MRRFLLCLSLLALAVPVFAQSPITAQILASDGNLYGAGGSNFYSLNPTTGRQTILNSSAPSLVLCLERSDGTLLGIDSPSANTWDAVDITLAGAINPIAQFPGTTASEPVCPALANDGNYYGSSHTGGDYNYGYIYQLTAAGKLNVFYNFTGGVDGSGSYVPPVQGSDGNLYWYEYDLLQRYSPATGLTAATMPYYPTSGSLVEAPDGNFYVPGDGGVLQITPAGAERLIYTPPTQDQDIETGVVDNLYVTGNATYPLAALVEYDYTTYNYGLENCEAYGNYLWMLPLALGGATGDQYFGIGLDELFSSNGANADDYYPVDLLLGGNGTFYASYTDYNEDDESQQLGYCNIVGTSTNYSNAFTTSGAAPITMSLSQTHVKPGGAATLTWQVNNAYSDTLQQCYGFGGLSGKVALTGSATVSAPSAGSHLSSIICGGTETGMATLVAGNAALSLVPSTKQVNQGAPVTLTATVTNAGTPLPTGKVNFLLGAMVIGSATLMNGTASFAAYTTGVPTGTYTITASYAGDANYGAATSPAVKITVIGKATTSTTLAPASQSVSQGAPISITATVAGTPSGGAPTGSVKFLVGSTVAGTVTLSAESSSASIATLTASTASIAPGTYSVTAGYGGDAANLPSNSAAATVTVKAVTPVALAISPNPVPAGSSFTLSATVKGKDTPSGTVFFYVNGTQELVSANVGSGGVAKVTLPAGTLATGTYQITASYAGDANNPAGTSPAVSLTVQ